MSAEAAASNLRDTVTAGDEAPPLGQWTLFWRRFKRHKLAFGSAIFLIALFIVAAFAPIFAPYDPNKTDLQLARFGEPAPPSLAHPMGTDNLGRDQLSRVIYGARVSLVVGFLATGVA